MKKVVKILNLDCANCAAKLENEISKLDGVKDVNISFLAEKMIIEIDDASYETVVKNIDKTRKKVEPDCEIVGL